MPSELIEDVMCQGGRRLVASLALMAFCVSTALAGGQDADGDGVADPKDNCVLHANATQADGDGDGWGNRCDGDFSNDGITNAIDLSILRQRFFTTDPTADLNDDGIVNIVDLAIMRELFFLPPGPAGFAHWAHPVSGNWDDPDNWFPRVVPPAAAHVTIAQPVPLVVTFAVGDGDPDATLQAASITSGGDLDMQSGGLDVAGDVTALGNLVIGAGARLSVVGDLLVEGVLTLDGGTLANARVLRNAASSSLVAAGSGSTLESVTLAADLLVSSGVDATVTGGLTLDGADIRLGSDGAVTRLGFAGTQMIAGTGSISFAGAASDPTLNRIWQSTGGSVLTIGSGITIRTATAGGSIGFPVGQVQIDGAVVADGAGHQVRVQGNSILNGSVTATGGADLYLLGVTNYGTISMSGDGLLELHGDWRNFGTISMSGDGQLELHGDWRNFSTISVSGGGLLELNGTWQNDGAIDVHGGALFTGGDWSNPGTIDLVDSNATLDGDFTLPDLHNITTDGPVAVRGGIDLAGGTLDLAGWPNGFSLAYGANLVGGTITGGQSLSVGPGASLVRLDNMTVGTDVEILDNSEVRLRNGLTLDNADLILRGDTTFCRIIFSGPQTLAGSGAIRFAGSSPSDDVNSVWRFYGDTVIIESGISVVTETRGGKFGDTGQGRIEFYGTLESNVDGRRLTVDGVDLYGSASAGNGGDLTFTGRWNLPAGGSIDMQDGGLLELNGDWINHGSIGASGSLFAVNTGPSLFDAWSNEGSLTLISTPAELGGQYATADLLSIATDSPISIRGYIDNEDASINLDDFPAGLSIEGGATIAGGTLNGSAPLALGPSAVVVTLDDVSLGVDLQVADDSHLRVRNSLTLDNAEIVFDSLETPSEFEFRNAARLNGNGTVRFRGHTPSGLSANLTNSGNPASLTIGAGVTLITEGSSASIGSAGGWTILEGTLINQSPGLSVAFLGSPITMGGDIAVGALSEVNFAAGSVVMAADATIDLDIAPTGNARIAFTGNVAFAGDLNIALVDGASPTECERFDIFTYGSFAGGFATISGPDFGGATFALDLLPTLGQLETPGTGC